MKKRLFAFIFSLLFIITGCSAKIQGQNLMVGVKAQSITGVNDLSEGSADVIDFAIRLLKPGNEEDRNTLLSPLSVLYALTMTANGAKEDTLKQMEDVLGMPIDQLNNYLYSYQKALPHGKDYKLNPANSIWFKDEDDFTVNQDFLQLNADYFGADIYKTPFDKSTLKDINHWVKDKTDGMIPEILDKIPEEAVMYLINALAFEAQWEEIYKTNQIRDGKFTLKNGKTQDASFMYGQEHEYLEDQNATGFLKYYKDHKYAFAALLPKEGISVSDYISSLDGVKLNKMLTNRQNVSVSTAIPKFESEYSTEMSKVLSNMGMPDAFDEKKADFTGLGKCNSGNIFINRVLHKTFISVGEKGTKAGAATVVEMNKESMALESKEVYLNRPFIYMLIDCETNIPFMIGTMTSLDNSYEPENVKSVKAEYKDKDLSMSLQIPKGWEYDIIKPGEIEDEDAGIHFWPKGEKFGKLKLTCQGSAWGVCGTGLEQKEISLGKYKAFQGTYDNREVWNFISFEDMQNHYVVWNENADHWWGAFGEEAMRILSTIQITENK